MSVRSVTEHRRRSNLWMLLLRKPNRARSVPKPKRRSPDAAGKGVFHLSTWRWRSLPPSLVPSALRAPLPHGVGVARWLPVTMSRPRIPDRPLSAKSSMRHQTLPQEYRRTLKQRPEPGVGGRQLQAWDRAMESWPKEEPSVSEVPASRLSWTLANPPQSGTSRLSMSCVPATSRGPVLLS